MEDLNKSQLILLAILVSFVTSIATGIMTVSLLNQTPLSVTQTINRVVERTVEKVVPGETKVKEVPVIVTEEELIIKVINNASPAVVKMSPTSDENKIIGLAYLVDDGKLAVTATDNLSANGPFFLFLENGVKATAELATSDQAHKFAILKITKTEVPVTEGKAATKAPTTPSIKLAKTEPSVGQTVIAIGSASAETSPVSVGIISSLTRGTGTSTVAIKANAITADNLGGPLVSIQGEVLGVNVAPGQAASVSLIRSLIDSVK